MRYANLHTHTDYSNTRLIDSINKVPDIISLAHKLDLRALAITDHEFLGGHLKALEYTNNKIKEEGWEDFKIILGNEIYLCRNGLNKETVEKGEKYPHFILLALDTEGHRQLRELSSRAWERSFMMFLKRVPTWYSDLEEIVMPNQGHIVATSACIGNILGIWFNNGELDKVEDHIKWCIKVFGEGNFYLEMSPAAYKEQVEYNKFLIELHNKYNVPLTIATDAHYGRPEDYPIHEAFLKSKEEDRETADFYKYTYLMTADEIYELMSYIDKEIITEALENTNKIADRVTGYDLYHGQVIPRLPDKRQESNFEYYLRTAKINPKYEYINKYIKSEYEDDRYGVFLVLDRLKQMNLSGERLEKHLKQIELELEEMWVVSDKIQQRLMSYFLTIKVVIEKIWTDVNSLTGPGRGSGPASLVCFLLGICDGDPLEQGFDLWFYRFIHRERAELPDWDFDSEASKKDAIRKAVYDMCKSVGGDSVAVCTFGTEGSRSALLTACRGMGLSNDIGQYLSSLIGQNRGFSYSLEDTYYGNPEKDIPASKEFKEEIDKYPDLFKTACAISGLITRLGQHACMDGETKIGVRNGVKPIKDITIGDEVLTHKGRYKKVLKTFVNETDEMLELSGRGFFENIKCTPNHPFLIKRNSNIQWIEAEKIQSDDYIGMPIINTEKNITDCPVELTNDVLYWMGRFVGDGWVEERKRNGIYYDRDKAIVICCGKTEKEELKSIFDKTGFHYIMREDRTAYKFTMNGNSELLQWMKRFGKGAYNKTIPDEILELPKDKLQHFIDGYMSADGYKKGFKTISPSLAYQLNRAFHKLENQYVTGGIQKTLGKEIIENRIVNAHDRYYGNFTKQKRDYSGFIEGNILWFKIDNIKRYVSKQKVYNLLVDEDNSYVVNGVIVHNCGTMLYNGNTYDMNALATTPSGTRVTQFDLGDSEKMGSIKYDFLSVDALDKIHVCMDLLIKDGYMEWQGSLRETYNKYLHPDVLDRTTKEMWDMLNNGKIISAFQMDSVVAKQTLASIHPNSLLELAATNSLMRLVPEKGHKSPAEEYLEYKLNPQKLYDEVYALNGTDTEKKILYNYLKKYNGVLESQENMMQITMIPEFTNFSFSDASKLRKIVAKKKLKEVDNFRKYFIETGLVNGCSEDILKYIWDVQIKRQLGYSFNLTHCTYYSLVGLQEMNLAYHYPSIYWATAVITVDAGALDIEDDSGTNYVKVATAIGRILSEGYKVDLPLINKAEYGFIPDDKNNTIIYGLKGISDINDEFIKVIIENRPYNSIEEFIEKCQPQKRQMISLIKAGAFNEFGDRKEIMNDYLHSICPKKARITLQNMNSLIDYRLIPKDLISYVYLYNFNKYLKQLEIPEGYRLDSRALNFLANNFNEIDISSGYLDPKEWKKIYDKGMTGIKTWLKDNEEELINAIQDYDVKDLWNIYCQGNYSAWEMDALGFYYSGHELANLKENITPSNSLVDGDFKHPVSIAGTVLGKEPYKHMVTILTIDGVIDLKFTKEKFAQYNRAISRIEKDGSKKVLEKSWFIKGTLVIATGCKMGETFRVRELSRIIEIDEEGNAKSTKYRYGEG